MTKQRRGSENQLKINHYSQCSNR